MNTNKLKPNIMKNTLKNFKQKWRTYWDVYLVLGFIVMVAILFLLYIPLLIEMI